MAFVNRFGAAIAVDRLPYARFNDLERLFLAKYPRRYKWPGAFRLRLTEATPQQIGRLIDLHPKHVERALRGFREWLQQEILPAGDDGSAEFG